MQVPRFLVWRFPISDSRKGTRNRYFRSFPGDLFRFGTFFLEAYPGDLKLTCLPEKVDHTAIKKKKNQFEILFLIGKHFDEYFEDWGPLS